MQRRVRRLVGRQQHHVAVAVDVCHRTLRLQERMLGPGRLEVAGDHVFRVGYCAVGVSPAHVADCLQVGALFVEDVGRIGLHRLKRAVDRRKDLVFNVHEFFRLFERLLIVCHNQRNRVAQVVRQTAHGHKRILVVLDVPDQIGAGNIVCCQHRAHARKRKRLRCIDGFDSCPCIFCADRRAVGHVRHIAVVGVFSVAEDLFLYIEPVHARADLPVVFRGRRNVTALTQQLCRQTHGSNDLHIARAAAVVVAQGIADFRIGGVLILIQKRLRTQDHARNAEAALHRASLAVGIGIELLFFLRQALDGKNMLSFQPVGHRRTGADGLAVDDHRTCPARTLRAAVLHGGQAQLVAQKAQQLLVFCCLNGLAVDKKDSHCKNSSS